MLLLYHIVKHVSLTNPNNDQCYKIIKELYQHFKSQNTTYTRNVSHSTH